MTEKKVDKLTKEILLDDFKLVHDILCKETDSEKERVTRDFYRKHGKYSDKDFNSVFRSFNNFKTFFYNQHSYEGINNQDYETITDQDLIELEIERKILALTEEVRDLKKGKDILQKQVLSEESILSEYKEKKLYIKSPIKLTVVDESSEEKEAILVLSDFHCGEVVKLSEVNGINEYNVEIMKERLDRIFYYTVHYCKKFNITKINLLFLGDLMSGSIHPELYRTNEYNDVEVLFILQEYITNKILEIESYFSSINCEFLVGNHSRITDGIGGSKPQWKSSAILNWEYVLAKQLKIQFNTIQKDNEDKKIFINVNEGLFKVVEIAERKFLITHGHALSNGSNSFAGIPYYGLSAQSAKIFGALHSTGEETQEFADILMGHLHCTSKVKTTTGNLFINGSVIGTGEFGLYKMRSISQPEQTLLIVEKGYIINEMTIRGNE